MRKIGKMNELAWLLGTVLCALGVALYTKADFGLSMFAAPAYIFHVTFSPYAPWLTQGVSEYLWQGVQLAVMCLLVRKFRLRFLFSFATAMAFGLCIDGWFLLLGASGAYSSLFSRIAAFAAGTVVSALAIAFYFRTDYPPQMAECLVVETVKKYGWPTQKVKQIVDLSFLTASVLFALLLTGKLTGIGAATVVVALLNAPLIGAWGKVLDKCFTFESALPKFHATYLRLTRRVQKTSVK